MERKTSLFETYLSALGVPHTRDYSNKRFATMTFKSLFGFEKLLEEYGLESEALQLQNPGSDLDRLTPPFLARTGSTFAIVTAVSDQTVSLDYGDGKGPSETARADFMRLWPGIVLLTYPTDDSREPDYKAHRLTETGNSAKRIVLAAAVVFVFIYLFVANGIYRHASTILLTAIDIGGLYVTYQLVLKSLNIHTRHADRLCGMIDRSGCNTVLETSASKFFGLFGWSEVGLSFFGVSLGCLLIFPQYTGYLALVDACACPFSLWSVWYQKYRAHAWCTLCLITQACLWLSLACYVTGGWFREAFPLKIEFIILGCTYVIALLGLNALMPSLDRSQK
ncbi:MAG: hypothetical protein K2F63_03725 [Muribaculaceae bacterium]|nr:hypothetical protein [Muribaculaceae bacterium]